MISCSGLSNLLFRAVCIFFSAVLLMMTMFSNAELMAGEESCTELENRITETETETEIIRAKLLNRLSLYELELMAVNELGMQRPGPEQLYFDMLPG